MLILLLLATRASQGTCEDFITHVEETLITETDTKRQSETIRELEDVYAYGDKSRFQDMFFDLNKYYKQEDLYYEYGDDSVHGSVGDMAIREDESEYFTKIGKSSSQTRPGGRPNKKDKSARRKQTSAER